MSEPRILILAGGTGGHIFPALAVAQQLRQRGIGLHWLGSTRGMEGRIVPRHNIQLTKIAISGLRGRGWQGWLLAPVSILYATAQAIIAILKLKPGVVLGMGGFVSGPGGLAAWLCRKPLVIHEQNAIAGMTNRIMSRFATRVLAGYPGAFVASRAVVTGNPVRADMTQKIARTPNNEFHVLVLGGSQGARRLNEVVPRALAKLTSAARLVVRHQCGDTALAATRTAYAESALAASVEPFIEDMATAYAWADLVICRAGAMTVAELAAVGVPSILVPFPYAVDDHQTANAQYLKSRGAAIVLREAELSPTTLHAALAECVDNDALLATMAAGARAAARPNAAAEVAGVCLELLNA